MSDQADGPMESSGWDAIDAALRPIYGDREPHHVGTVVPYALGGPDPIHGISAYANDGPSPHWHYITYGFSELWEKRSSNPEVSGYGFELTFRCAREPGERTPPNWALNFLQNLGRYVFETGNGFGVGHTIPANGPIEQGSPTLIHAISFAHDPQLPPVDTTNGRVAFLQVVGLTMDELSAISSWDASAFLELLRGTDPLLITDLSRRSWLDSPAFAAEVARATDRDGSSCGWLSLELACDISVDRVAVRIQTIAAEAFARRLLGRLPYGRELVLNGDSATVVLRPGEHTGLKVAEGAVVLTLRTDDARAWCRSLGPRTGSYPIPGLPGVILEVVRTEIRDRDGNVVDVVE